MLSAVQFDISPKESHLSFLALIKHPSFQWHILIPAASPNNPFTSQPIIYVNYPVENSTRDTNDRNVIKVRENAKKSTSTFHSASCIVLHWSAC